MARCSVVAPARVIARTSRSRTHMQGFSTLLSGFGRLGLLTSSNDARLAASAAPVSRRDFIATSIGFRGAEDALPAAVVRCDTCDVT